MKIFIFLICLIAIPAFAQDQKPEAPFGLQWGMSKAEVESTGVTLKPIGGDDSGSSDAETATGLKKTVSGTESMALNFGLNDKLFRIMAISKNYENDPYGSQVKSRYDELNKILTAKYKNKKIYQRLGDSIFAEPEYFVAGIRNGKSLWATAYDDKPVSVVLSILSTTSDAAYWRLEYEYVPLRDEWQAQVKEREKGAL